MTRNILRLPIIYTLAGVLAGLIFPLLGTHLEMVHNNIPWSFNAFLITQSQQPLLWLIDLAPLIMGLLAAMLGIRVKSTADLTRRESEWQAIFDSIPDPVFLLDEQGSIMQCNRAVRNVWENDLGSPIGRTISFVIGHDFFLPLEGQDLMEMELDWRGRNFACSIRTLQNPNLKKREFVFILHDITERKRRELFAEWQKQFFEALVANSPVAIVVLDKEGIVTSLNPAFEALFGYKREEILGQEFDTLINTPETLGEAKQYTQDALDKSISVLGTRQRKDGSSIQVEILGVPVYVGGEKVGVLGIYHDVTALLKAQQEAENSNRAKSEFLANMSHEIRTPMNGVIGMLELLMDSSMKPEQEDYVQTALQSAESLMVLLNDILDFSKIEAGRLELEITPIILRALVEEVAYTMAKRAQDKGLEMACYVDSGLSSHLEGDPGRLRQVLVNLVGNAIKFTRTGEIVIRAEKVADTTTHVTARISVQDTGIGIPEEKKAIVFERFTQADGSTTRHYGGTGLGLTISKQLVEMMGGTIGVESREGQGSLFWCEIPLKKTLRDKHDTTPLFRKTAFLAGIRVLVVDDNQTNRQIQMKNVEAMGCRCRSAAGGKEALEFLRKAHRVGERYDLVLLDRMMPEMDGEQTLRAILSDPALMHLKVIILTSMTSTNDAPYLLDLGAAGYLYKPVKQQLLMDAIITALEKGGQTDSSESVHEKPARRKGGRILLAEDNSINQKLALILLRREGYEVEAVENGHQAVERVLDGGFELVLMDVQMPGMNGMEATKAIRDRENGKGDHIPIIAMTAYAMQGDRDKCLQAGMDDYVSKPLQPKILLAVLDRWLPGGSSRLKDGSIAVKTQPENLPERIIPAESKAPVDIDLLLSFLGGELDVVKEILAGYCEQLPKRMEEIKAAQQSGNATEMMRQAHNLKGVSLNLRMDDIGRLASDLEHLAEIGDMDHSGAVITQLESEVLRLEQFMKQSILENPVN